MKMTYVCSICGKMCEGYPNNADPVTDGICCDDCNFSKVIPARIERMNKVRE